MRFDRFITLALGQPLRRAGSGAWRLPILMYHGISDVPEAAGAGYYQTNTRPEVFRRQLEVLAELGYRTFELAQALARLREPGPAGEKCVVITFDDGFRNFYVDAFPALQTHGFTATVFLPTAFIGEPRRAFKSAECLTWAEVRELRQHGIGFGSHTVSHPELERLSRPEIERELRVSKSELEERLGEPVTTFAYPFAFPQHDREFTRRLRKMLGEAGYACCATTELGRVRPGDDPFRLKRLPVNSLDDPALFRAKLEGAYDWMAWPQWVFKWVKSHP